MPRPASNDVLTEMVRAIREEQLPAMHREITVRLDRINGTVLEHTKDIGELQKFQAVSTNSSQTIKYLVTVLFTFAGLVIATIKLLPPHGRSCRRSSPPAALFNISASGRRSISRSACQGTKALISPASARASRSPCTRRWKGSCPW